MTDDLTTVTTPSPVDMVDIGNMSNNGTLYDLGYSWCEYTNDSLSSAGILILLFSVFGVLGNACLLFVILRRRYLRTLTNILVVNLAASDIVLFVTTVPFYLEADLHPCWQFGTAVCKTANTVWVISHSTCMFTLAALAVERYCVVTSRAGFRSTTCALVSIWLLSTLLALPVLITAHMPYEGVCMAFTNEATFEKGYITSHSILTFVVPLIIIAISYSRMARTLVKDSQTAQPQKTNAEIKELRKRRRLATVVLVLVLMFAFFWTPFHLFNVLSAYGVLYRIPWDIVYSLFVTHYVLIYIYLFLNPIVIFFMSAHLRRELITCRREGRRRMRKQDFVTEGGTLSFISDNDLELHEPMNKNELGEFHDPIVLKKELE